MVILVLNQKTLRELARLALQLQDLLSLPDQLVLHEQFELLVLHLVFYYLLKHFFIIAIELYIYAMQRQKQSEEWLEVHLNL